MENLEGLHFDLEGFASEDRLVRAVFESDQIDGWQAGSGSLCLTLDGFDQALNRVETLDSLLSEYLKGWDTKRLFIRVVCRTADWPQSLRHTLEDRFGDANVHELLPLRRSDAGLLLGASGLDAEGVLAAVEQARIVPLAARPITLKLIESSIAPDGSLPHSAQALYDRGLRALLDETNPHRRGAIQVPGGVSRRMQAAERIAALSLFGGRPTVWTGPVAEAVPDDLSVDECVEAHGREGSGISSDEVAATLRSGIFTGAGEGRLTWSHATFADFLCARWILTKELDDEQVASLLVANDGRIHARTRQTAAWLVALAPARFRGFVQADPQAFLASVDLPDEQLRSEVVSALLQDAQAGNVFDDYGVDYSGLRHSGLAEQLQPVLASAQGEACHVAIRIARQSSVVGSIADLTLLALNDDVDLPLRTSAAMTLHDLSASAPSHDLVTLIGTSAGRTDVDTQELEAAALIASWPHAVSTGRVFAVLSPSYPRNFFGLYSIFVDRFAKGLQESDLDPACAWILADPSRVDDSRLARLVGAILKLCLANLGRESAREVIAAVAIRRLEDFQPLFGDPEFLGDQVAMGAGTRRMVTQLLLDRVTEEQVWWIVDQSPGLGGALLLDDDLEWLIEVYATSDGLLRSNAGRAAQQLVNPALVAHSSVVLGLPDGHPARELFAYWHSAIELDSAEANKARDQWRERAERRRRRLHRQSERDDDWVNPRIAADLAKAATGDASAFWYAARLVTVRPGTQRFMDEFQPDLTLHPRWNDLTEAVRADFVTAARVYVENGECRPDEWFAKNKVYYPAQAGYRALILLLRLAPDALEVVSPHAWRQWAPILIDWAATINGASEKDKRRLLSLARPHAEAELRAGILTLVDKAIDDQKHVFLRTEFEVLSSDVLATELVDRLADATAAETRGAILDFLVEQHLGLIAPVLRTWLADAARKEFRSRALDAASRLLWHDVKSSWALLGALMDDDVPFMEEAMLAAAHAFQRRIPELPPQGLADLYLWLCEHFPPAEDPIFDDAHMVGSRESLGTWRNALLIALSKTGTRDAVAAIERIVQARPDEPWMARLLIDAERALRERSWEPLSPKEVDQLAQSRRTRVVRSDADLLAATLAALDDIQARLQADTPSAFLLWDTHAKRPKSEEEISDYLAIELEQRLNARGVVINREVQVRRSKPAGLPERTDLRVEAVRHHDATGVSGTLRIPGEVKGIWNAGVIQSLEAQLVQRYMADFQTNHGVYIVAWFDQVAWAVEDSRRSRAATHGGAAEIRARQEGEAAAQRAMGHDVAVRVLDCSLMRPVVGRG
ncbi:hypothetical protein ACH47X_16570 [Promicromonospora kroppenstedtii]|uniref:Uncharacterized protein n=1 Tax=Promicromonospora kroppenstedtii TaxID=440482 RepID=A0ABW7XMI8_9MICO